MTQETGACDSTRFTSRLKEHVQMIGHAAAERPGERTRASAPFAAWLLSLCLLVLASVPAQAGDDTGNEYRLTLFPYHRISDQVTGSGYLGYVWNPEKDYQTYYLGWPVASYAPESWLQIWGGLVGLYTDNESSADKLELRPFTGVKLFLPNGAKWNIYNFTRYEYRAIQNRDTDDWNNIHRLRSRFGAEFPFTSREGSWQPKTFYGLADVEPYYRFDQGEVDPLRVRGGMGYVVNDHIRMEFIYHAQFTRPAGSSGLEYTDNIFRLNIKIGLTKGIIGRLQNPDLDE
jgi:hypothetical protein